MKHEAHTSQLLSTSDLALGCLRPLFQGNANAITGHSDTPTSPCSDLRLSVMRAIDVTDTIELALAASGCDQAVVRHMPRLLSDNGSCYISGDLAEWLEDQKMDHVRGAPFHPQTQGKIERWHQTMKNRVLLENYYLPGDLERQISVFVDYYNNERYHESLNNVTPADVYFGRDKAIIREREKIKKLTIQNRRLQHQRQAA